MRYRVGTAGWSLPKEEQPHFPPPDAGTHLTRYAAVLPAAEIDIAFARDEGEGFESVEDWHAAHERFFERTIAPDTLISAIRFRVVERL